MNQSNLEVTSWIRHLRKYHNYLFVPTPPPPPPQFCLSIVFSFSWDDSKSQEMVFSKVANIEPSAWNARNNLTCIDFGLVFWLAEKVTRYFLANQWPCVEPNKSTIVFRDFNDWKPLSRFTQLWSPSLQLQVRKIQRYSDWDKDKKNWKTSKELPLDLHIPWQLFPLAVRKSRVPFLFSYKTESGLDSEPGTWSTCKCDFPERSQTSWKLINK